MPPLGIELSIVQRQTSQTRISLKVSKTWDISIDHLRERFAYLLFLQMRILRPALIPLRPQQRSNLLRITKPLRLHRTIWQEHTNQSSNTHRHRTNSHKEDPPAGKFRLHERKSIRQQAPKDHRERIAHIEPTYSPSLLFFLVPHGDDQDEDWRYTAFEDAEESTADGKASEGCTCCVAAEDEAP